MHEHEPEFSQQDGAEIHVNQAFPFGQFPTEPEGLHGEALEEYKLQVYAVNSFVKKSFWITCGFAAVCAFGVILSIVLGIIFIAVIKPIAGGVVLGLIVGIGGLLAFLGLFAGFCAGYLYYFKKKINNQLAGCDRMKLTYHLNFKLDTKARHYISIRDFQ